MEQAILTHTQKTALSLVGDDPALRRFYLSGGTALSAFFLQHRVSDDLDFFTPNSVPLADVSKTVQKIKQAIGAQEVRSDRLHDRHLFFFELPDGELKLEFSQYPFDTLEPLVLNADHHVYLDSLRDIAANKLMALLDRFDPKDFVDLYFLLQSRTLQAMQADAEVKFGVKIGDLFLGSELAKVRRVEALPKMQNHSP